MTIPFALWVFDFHSTLWHAPTKAAAANDREMSLSLRNGAKAVLVTNISIATYQIFNDNIDLLIIDPINGYRQHKKIYAASFPTLIFRFGGFENILTVFR